MAAVWGGVTVPEIREAVGGEQIGAGGLRPPAGLSTDSRSIRPGELFWALRGERYDGHQFLESALERKAAGAVIEAGYRRESGEALTRLTEKFQDRDFIVVADTLRALGDLARWWRRQHNCPVAAITGSSGKTTTKEMAAEILAIGGPVLKNPGNFNNLVGLPLSLLALTPQHGKAVLELGMNRPGEIARLTEIAEPDVGLITNVGKAHLAGLGSLENVARAKLELMEQMDRQGEVLLNGDDTLLVHLATRIPVPFVSYGLGEGNAVRATDVADLGADGASFTLRYEGNVRPVRLFVPGTQNVINAVAAAAAAIFLQAPGEHIVEGLARFRGVPGRFALSRLKGDILLIDDTYNANPSSLKAALESLAGLGRGRKAVIGLGEMMELGEAAEAAHREAGREVAKLGAAFFAAMGEHAPEMIREARSGGLPLDRTMVARNHRDMARAIREHASPSSLIFLKGSRKVGLDRVVEALKSEMS